MICCRSCSRAVGRLRVCLTCFEIAMEHQQYHICERRWRKQTLRSRDFKLHSNWCTSATKLESSIYSKLFCTGEHYQMERRRRERLDSLQRTIWGFPKTRLTWRTWSNS